MHFDWMCARKEAVRDIENVGRQIERIDEEMQQIDREIQVLDRSRFDFGAIIPFTSVKQV
jgi:hypothetical protein